MAGSLLKPFLKARRYTCYKGQRRASLFIETSNYEGIGHLLYTFK